MITDSLDAVWWFNWTPTAITSWTDRFGISWLNTFNGTTSWISMWNVLNFQSLPYTVSFWVNQNETWVLDTDNKRTVDKAQSWWTNWWWVDMRNDSVRMFWNINLSATWLSLWNQRKHITCISNGSGTWWIYVDWQLVATWAYASANAWAGALLMWVNSAWGNRLTWKMSWVSIRNRALSAGEVKSLYDLTSKKYLI